MDELRRSTGRIFDIQRFSLHDGPGVRTTVFLQGCPLRCVWCHNPEGLVARAALSFAQERCAKCGQCVSACGHGGHAMVDGMHRVERGRCVGCGACVAACDAGALELVGRTATAGEVIDEVVKDEPFYRHSGGGLTVSGGEPTQQVEFLAALLHLAGARGIHRVVETCGYGTREQMERILPLTELFLFDLKDTDDARHVAYTGVGNERILERLRQLHDGGAAVVLRLPIIPGMNDRDDHFERVGELVRALPELHGVEVIPYHGMGEKKRERFGLPPTGSAQTGMVEEVVIRLWLEKLRAAGAPAECADLSC